MERRLLVVLVLLCVGLPLIVAKDNPIYLGFVTGLEFGVVLKDTVPGGYEVPGFTVFDDNSLDLILIAILAGTIELPSDIPR